VVVIKFVYSILREKLLWETFLLIEDIHGWHSSPKQERYVGDEEHGFVGEIGLKEISWKT